MPRYNEYGQDDMSDIERRSEERREFRESCISGEVMELRSESMDSEKSAVVASLRKLADTIASEPLSTDCKIEVRLYVHWIRDVESLKSWASRLEGAKGWWSDRTNGVSGFLCGTPTTLFHSDGLIEKSPGTHATGMSNINALLGAEDGR